MTMDEESLDHHEEATTMSDADIEDEVIAPIHKTYRHSLRTRKCSTVLVLLLFAIAAAIFIIVGARSAKTGKGAMTSPALTGGSTEHMSSGGGGTSTTNSGSSTSGRGSTSTSTGQEDSSEILDGGGDEETVAPNVCDDLYVCQTTIIGHDTPLFAGQGICNADYRFGVTPDGIFQWHDCASQEKKVIYDPANNQNATAGAVSYFSMSRRGVLRLMDDLDQVIWHKESKVDISFSKECLQNPLMDCPYLQLHNTGDVILNTINDAGWSHRKLEGIFVGVYQD